MKVILSPSTRSGKKWMVKLENDCIVHFGADGYEDYTMHKDPRRRKNYLARHRTGQDWLNFCTAGAWSRWLLWEWQSMAQAIRGMKRKHGITIVRKR
jgi:hypothetical protein